MKLVVFFTTLVSLAYSMNYDDNNQDELLESGRKMTISKSGQNLLILRKYSDEESQRFGYSGNFHKEAIPIPKLKILIKEEEKNWFSAWFSRVFCCSNRK